MNAERLALCLTVLAAIVAPSWASDAGTPSQKSTLYIIPHTHWEGAVFKTREEYLHMGLPNILKAIHLLKTQPDYRFVLDQVAYVRPFLERYPEQAADFRKFVKEGRLQLVLGMDIMPDDNMPGGETFIRQMQYGKGYYHQQLGVDVTAAWLIDTFGHHAQLPQLLRRAGYKSFWFSRGVPKADHPSEFLWEGIDGTRIPAFWLPYSYGLGYGSPRDLAGFTGFMQQRYDLLAPNAKAHDRVALSGVDVSEPEEHLAPMVKAYNEQPNPGLRLRLAVPSDFEAVVNRRINRPVFRGEFNPIFQGTYSSRIELKRRMRDMERLLTTAEKLSAIAQWLGRAPDNVGLWRAWEPVLFNETHDLASGVMTDHVYADTVRSYDFAERLANEQIDRAWDRLAGNIDTRGPGLPLLVLNTLGWPRTDIVEAKVSFAAGGVASLDLMDNDRHAVPVQVVYASRYGDGGLKEARIAFVARDVPGLGYRLYHVVPKDAGHLAEMASTAGSTMSNEFFKLQLDPQTGAIISLKLRRSDWEVLAGQANVATRTTDHGDLWELYRGLDGGSKIAMTTKELLPRRGAAAFSDDEKAPAGVVRTGPVFSEFQIAHPFAGGGFETVIRMYRGIQRIDIWTTLLNREKFVRYQAVFPTTIKNGVSTHSIPLGAIDRPAGIEFPAQDWVDYSDGHRGLGLLNVGLPGNVQTNGTLMLSLLRSHTLGAYGFGGGYEPGMSSDSGLELGQPRTVAYALVPHEGDWRTAGVFRAGLELNNPLICRKAEVHSGPLPRRWGFLQISHPDVVLSSVKPGARGCIFVRMYEATGRPAKNVNIRFRPDVISAWETNLLEDPERRVAVDDYSVQLDLHGFEVKTLRLRIKATDEQGLKDRASQ